ncbi:MAG: hypothetical protein NTY74_16135 [Ignavibacteriae bacterium]|nr:hypothetical protein [Ignavibacteriota bacterium]
MKTLFKTLGMLGLFFFLLGIATPSDAQIKYWKNKSTGSWNTAAIWQSSTDDIIYDDDASYPNKTSMSSETDYPTDFVRIVTGTMTFNQSSIYLCYLSIETGAAMTVSTTKKLYVYKNESEIIGSFYVQANATFTIASTGSATYGTFTTGPNVYSEITIDGCFNNGPALTTPGKYAIASFSGTLVNHSTKLNNYNTLTSPSSKMFQIKGIFRNYEDLATEGNISMVSGCIYEHCFTEAPGTIPNSLWAANSTCKIESYTLNADAPGGLGQTFANLIWNCPNQESDINFLGSLNAVGGDFTVSSTGTGSISFDVTDNLSPLTISGTFTLEGGKVYLNNFIDFANDNTYTNLSGNVVLTGGTLKNCKSGSSIGYITFNKQNTPQVLTINLTSIQGKIAFKVASGSSLEFGNSSSVLLNTDLGSTFDVLTGGALRIRHIYGISSSGSTGCIQVGGTRTFSNSGTYDYCGDELQITGNGLPTSLVAGQIIIGNPSGVKLSNNYDFSSASGGLTVNNSGYLICNSYYISGSGFFTFNSGCKIAICSANGIVGGVTSVGNIRNSGTKTLNTEATYEYVGTSAQTTGSALPSSVQNLLINNSSATGVTLTNDVTVSNSLTLTDGELITNSKNLIISNSYTITSGTISGDNASTLTINGSGAITGSLTFTPSYQVLKTLTINRSAGTVTLGSPLTLDGTTDGTLNLTAGTLDISGRTLTFIKGNTPIVKGAGFITTSTNSGLVFGTEGNTGGSAFLIPAGTFTSAPIVNNFSVNRTNSLTLTQDLNVNGTLTLTSGLLIGSTNNNLVTLGNASGNGILSLPTPVTTGRIVGNFKRFLSSPDKTYIFPIGTTTNYNGIVIDYAGGVSVAGSLTAAFTVGDPGNNNNPNPIDDANPTYTVNKYSQFGYWTILNTTVAGTYSIDVNTNGFTGIRMGSTQTDKDCRSNLRLLKRSGSTVNWSLENTYVAATGDDHTNMVVKRAGLTTFSEFALGSNMNDNNFDGPLPVTLSSFNSTLNARDVNLKWVTSSEINNAGFDVERKTIEGTWSKVGYVKGNGTVNSSSTYNFTDRKLNAGKFNYRLKQIDNNGNFEYHNLSGTVEVGVPKDYALSQNYPNPFNPTTKIDFALPFDSKVYMVVYDMTGREVKTLVNEARQAGYHTVEMNASMLSSGTYFFRIIANANGKDFISTKKMVLVK